MRRFGGYLSALPERFPVLLINLLVLLIAPFAAYLSAYLPPGPHVHGPGLIDKFLCMDGLHYQNIALNGYGWQFADSAQPYSIAFFPLYPLTTTSLSYVFGTTSAWVFILPALLFGLGSNAIFYLVAKQILPEKSAVWATLFFAFWPACCFHFMGYPTGLGNLCALLSLYHYISGRMLRATMWCGVGTAAAPALVFFAIGLCGYTGYQWLCDKFPLARVPELFLFGLLSASGLIGFIIFQQIKFHDPLAFVYAQQAWTRHEDTLAEHLGHLFSIYWYLAVFVFVQKAVAGALHGNWLANINDRNNINIAFQYLLGWLLFWASLAATWVAALKFPQKLLAWTGACLWLGYLWFNVTGVGYFFNATRLLYPAIAIFLVLGWKSANHRLVGSAILTCLILLAVCDTSLMLAGYDML